MHNSIWSLWWYLWCQWLTSCILQSWQCSDYQHSRRLCNRRQQDRWSLTAFDQKGQHVETLCTRNSWLCDIDRLILHHQYWRHFAWRTQTQRRQRWLQWMLNSNRNWRLCVYRRWNQDSSFRSSQHEVDSNWLLRILELWSCRSCESESTNSETLSMFLRILQQSWDKWRSRSTSCRRQIEYQSLLHGFRTWIPIELGFLTHKHSEQQRSIHWAHN